MTRKLKIRIEGLDRDSVKYAVDLSSRYNIEASSHPEYAADMIMTLGGDGSVIYNKKSRLPILPVRLVDENKNRKQASNTSQGFITNQSILELDRVYKRLEAGEYRIDELLTLDLYVNDSLTANAINDIYLTLKDPRKAMRFDLFKNSRKIFDYKLIADGMLIGVVVATPLGSTGYNSSAGGYVLDQKDKRVVATRLLNVKATLSNPVGLTKKADKSRVIGINDQSIIEIKVYRPEDFWVCVDGDELFSARSSDKIKIKRPDETLKLVKIKGKEESLESKMRRREKYIRDITN